MSAAPSASRWEPSNHHSQPIPQDIVYYLINGFGVALFISRWIFALAGNKSHCRLEYSPYSRLRHGQLCRRHFAAYTGAGVDGMIFIVLTLAFGIDERMSTPTTVIVMAVVSIVGFALHGLVVQDIVLSKLLACCRPDCHHRSTIGAYFLTKISRDVLIVAILVLIAAEMLSTAILTRSPAR